MLRPFHLLLACLCCWYIPQVACAAGADFPHLRVELLQEEETVQPGRPFWVAVHLEVEEGWHVYWKNPGDAGIPLQVTWRLPQGFQAGPLQWPFPQKFSVAGLQGLGYHGEVTLLTQITPPDQLDVEAILEAQVDWLVCSSSSCQPGSACLALPLAVSSSPPQRHPEQISLFDQARGLLPKPCIQANARLMEHGIQLEVPVEAVALDTITRVDFFPETGAFTEGGAEWLMPIESQSISSHVVHIKGDAHETLLKGVLVFYGPKEGHEVAEAMDIAPPIANSGDAGAISMLADEERPVALLNPQVGSAVAASSWSFEGGVSMALAFAFLGGIILNFMPCVLPVISLKVMSFVQMGRQSRLAAFKQGVMFSLGVLVSFWLLAGVMLLLRAYGQAVGWGFQLQEPLFVVALAALLFVFALSLFGLFELGLSLSSWAGQTQSDSLRAAPGYGSSFWSGVLATAVATPCTGPFLGSAVGFAVTLPFWQALLIFTSVALGMCFPYLLLALVPGWLRFLPKPGPWMETFKQWMGFVLLATVLWLLWVFGAQTDALALISVLGGFLCFAIAAWLYGRCIQAAASSRPLYAYASVALWVLLGSGMILWPPALWDSSAWSATSSAEKGWEGWERFSPERVAELQSQGKPFLIDFTAKWCLICQANHMVLQGVADELSAWGVVKMQADWTKNDPAITAALSRFGRSSVPLYVLYGPTAQEPLVLPQVLTADVVRQHLRKAVSTSAAASDDPSGIALR